MITPAIFADWKEKQDYLFSIGCVHEGHTFKLPGTGIEFDECTPSDWKWATSAELIRHIVSASYNLGRDEQPPLTH